jgi:imidazolonepropionase-like amidohydrolase
MSGNRTSTRRIVSAALALWAAEAALAMSEEGDKKADEGLSLRPARVLEFTAREATWLSLDVSPDGRTIVFDLKLRRFVPPNIIEANTRRLQWFRKDEYVFPQTAEQAAKILRAGGLVGVGSHGQLQGLGYHWEMWALARGGMTPIEVLRCATILGARIIGLEEDLGSIKVGKLADLVVLDRNPLEDIHHTNSVRWVVKNGEIFEGDSLKQVWPVEKEVEPLWWWEE